MIIHHSKQNEKQLGNEFSFIGGKPMLPKDWAWPVYSKHKEDLTFFFQLQMPPSHKWAGSILSVFSKTQSCDNEDYIPKLPRNLRDTHLTASFFDVYQTFFRVFIFEQDKIFIRESAKEMIEFHELIYSDPLPKGSTLFGAIDNHPIWVTDNEAPRTFDGAKEPIEFLFQTRIDYKFKTIPGSPRQKVPNYSTGVGLMDSNSPNYELFASNECYYFGIENNLQRLVYIVPQS